MQHDRTIGQPCAKTQYQEQQHPLEICTMQHNKSSYINIVSCLFTPSKDLNSQLDQAEAQIAAARQKNQETEQQLMSAREELAGVGGCGWNME